MTPYTSLASSSKGRPVVGWEGGGVAGGKVDGTVGGEVVKFLTSPKATTTPELELRVFRGLPNWVGDAKVSEERGATARETAGRMLPSTAGFGRFTRCQS